MYCIPACKGCVEAGSCPRGELPASAFLPPKRRTAPRRAAVAATYPRDLANVIIHLACGHPTTKEAQVFFSVWREDDSTAFCERCKRFVGIRRAAAPDPLPDVPSF